MQQINQGMRGIVKEGKGMTQFKIGDHAIHDDYKVVLPIMNKVEKKIINAQEGYRLATEDEIELHYLEVEG